MVARRQIDVANVVRAIVIFDLPTGPVETFDTERFARIDVRRHWNVAVPAVDDYRIRLFCRQLCPVDANYLLHGYFLLRYAATRRHCKSENKRGIATASGHALHRKESAYFFDIHSVFMPFVHNLAAIDD